MIGQAAKEAAMGKVSLRSMFAAIFLMGGPCAQAALPEPHASHPAEGYHLPLPLPPGVTIQTALDASNTVVLSAGSYASGAAFTLRSGQRLYGDPAGTAIPSVTIAPGATNAVLSTVTVGGTGVTFPYAASNAVTRNCVFERLGGKIAVAGGRLEENLFLHTDGTLNVNTITNGYLRNNRFIRTKTHASSDQVILRGDVLRQSYGNVFLWRNFLTPGADSTLIDNQGDLTFVGVDAESWNWWGTGTNGALWKVGRMGTFRVFGMNGGNHRYGTNADGIAGTADDAVTYDNRTAGFDVDADEFQLYNDSMERSGTSIVTGATFIDYKLGANNRRSLLVNSSNSGKVWANAAADPFRLKGFDGGLIDTSVSTASSTNPVWTTRTSPLSASEQETLAGMVVQSARPAGSLPWEVPVHGPIPDPAGPGWATNLAGQSDSTAYIQGLIDSNGIARLPAGTYFISQPLKLRRLQGIVGAGADTTVIIAKTNTLDMVVANDAVTNQTGTQIVLTDITFQGGRNGIHFEPVGTCADQGRFAQYTACTFSHVTFRDMSNAGIFMDQIYALDNIFFSYVHFVNCDTGLKQKVDPTYTAGETPTMMYMDKCVFYQSQFVGNRLALDLPGARSCNLNAWINCLFQDNRGGAASMANYLSALFANCDFINNGGTAVVANNYTVGHVSNGFSAGTNGVSMFGGPVSADGCIFDRAGSSTAKILNGSNSRFFLNNCATTNMPLRLPAGANGMLINTALGMDPALNQQVISLRAGAVYTLLPGTPSPAANNAVLPTLRVFPQMQSVVPGDLSDVVATGGSTRIYDGCMTHTFTNSGEFVVTAGGSAEVLIVAGGGGGGVSAGGGGGAGGLILTNLTLLPGSYAVTVGIGGAGGRTNSSAVWASSNGQNSALGVLVAQGGGGGAGVTLRGGTGGSGGGGSRWSNGSGLAGAGTNAQGKAGGSAPWVSGLADIAGAGGGGGGSAGASVASNSNIGGNGGTGVLCTISGTAVWYAGGGGGGSRLGTPGLGGLGGGGNAGKGALTGGTGAPNTGGGGGAGGMVANTFYPGGAGGSGIVIIRYRVPVTYVSATGGVASRTNGYAVHVFTNSGSLVVSSGGDAEVLIVAGGGGGGTAGGGGGGGGGVLHYDRIVLAAGTNAVVVGAGGAGGTPSVRDSSDGENSSLGPWIALGGGGGGSVAGGGHAGGSGGGGSRWSNGGSWGGGVTSGQGNAGGDALWVSGAADIAGGGGGGAGGIGASLATNSAVGGNGGAGVVCVISGASVWYAGGGGGGSRSGTPGLGGSGGGGNGSRGASTGGTGTPNTGGGGGGGGMLSNTFYAGGAGGSGIVIVRYPLPKRTMIFVR